MSNRPFSLTNLPEAPKKARLEKPYSLRNPPRAPKRENAVQTHLLGQISRLILPPTPPIIPQPPRKKARRTPVDLTPIPLDWGMTVAEREARFLADTRCVRVKFLLSSPKQVESETNIEFLEKLWELYFPPSQPHNAYEEAYLSLMRECIEIRLGLLRKM